MKSIDIITDSKSKCISLETYKKNDEAIKTPVWFVAKNNLLYIVTRDQTGKIKRLRNNQKVKVAPCTFKGKVTGEWFSGTAEFLSQEKTNEAVKWRDKKYGFFAKVAKFVSKSKGELIAFSIKLE